MSHIYIVQQSWGFSYHSKTNELIIPTTYEEISSILLACSKQSMSSLRIVPNRIFNYFHLQPHRLLEPLWIEIAKQRTHMLVFELPPIDRIYFMYGIVQMFDRSYVVLDTANQRVFLPDGRILPENKAQEWHEQIQEMMASGQQQMDLGFPQSNPLIKKHFIEQLSPQLTDLGFVVSTQETDIVFTHPQHQCQLNIGLDGECGMYEIFADLIFHQATEQIAQLFNQPFTGSELTVSVNQLINWQLPVDYRSIRSFDDATRFIERFNQHMIPLLKQLN